MIGNASTMANPQGPLADAGKRFWGWMKVHLELEGDSAAEWQQHALPTDLPESKHPW